MTTDTDHLDRESPSRHFAPQRQQRILDIVNSRRAARLEDLGNALGVSVATARRDVDELASQGLLRRVHGGAVAVDVQRAAHFQATAVEAAPAPVRIAATAGGLQGPPHNV